MTYAESRLRWLVSLRALGGVSLGCMERIDSHRDGLVSKMHDDMAVFVVDLRGEHMRGDLPPARVP